MRARLLGAGILAALLAGAPALRAQPINLSQGGPIEITSADGLEWHQNEQEAIARGNARAIRGDVTVIADQLIAYFRRKPGATPASANAGPPAANAGPPPANVGPLDTGTGSNEVYRLEAVGNVHIYTPTDRAQGDRAVYDMDQAVLVMTGTDLRLSSPQDVLTARDAVEYWSQKHMAVARGDAVVTTSDGRRLSADTLVAYMSATAPTGPARPAPAPAGTAAPDDLAAASGRLERVEVFGNVQIRTATQTVRGDRGVYVPDTGIAVLDGDARLTQGENQVNGAAMEVDLKTGVYRLLAAPGARVRGLITPNDATQPAVTAPATPPATPGLGKPH